MTVVLYDVAGHDWGWFTRSARMHLQPMDARSVVSRRHARVWLETRGVRTFAPARKLRDWARIDELELAVSKERRRLERSWVRTMILTGWLKVHIEQQHLTLDAYAGTPFAFTRRVDLRATVPDLFEGREGDDAAVTLHPTLGTLGIGRDRNDGEVPHLSLGDMLFVEETLPW